MKKVAELADDVKFIDQDFNSSALNTINTDVIIGTDAAEKMHLATFGEFCCIGEIASPSGAIVPSGFNDRTTVFRLVAVVSSNGKFDKGRIAYLADTNITDCADKFNFVQTFHIYQIFGYTSIPAKTGPQLDYFCNFVKKIGRSKLLGEQGPTGHTQKL